MKKLFYILCCSVATLCSSCVKTHNGHEFVDLGLPSGTLWATCNVGADSPEDYGDYFAWGEIQPKEAYSWNSYKWCNKSNDTQFKYCTATSHGNVDNKTVLGLIDDAANVNWGGSWRIPTVAELDELRTRCVWTWTTQNGEQGYKVTSKKNGNSIFLPAAGHRGELFLYDAGSGGYYWSSSLDMYDSNCAYTLLFGTDKVYWNEGYNKYCGSRGSGNSIRPVCVK